MAETIYRGEFWLPRDPDDRHQGTAIIDEEAGTIKLDLMSGFPLDPAFAVEVSPGVLQHDGRSIFGDEPLILGDCGGLPFTFVDCRFYEGDGMTKRVFRPQRSFRGVNLAAKEDEVFQAVNVEIDYLIEWTGLSSFVVEQDDLPDQKLSGGVTHSPQISQTASWGGLEFTLVFKSSAFNYSATRAGSRTVSATEEAWIRVESSTPKSYEFFDGVVSDLQDMLTICMTYPCAVRWCTLTAKGEAGQPVSVRLDGRRIYRADSRPYRWPREPLMMAKNLSFAQIIPAWFNLASKIEIANGMVLSLLYVPVSNSSMKVMTMASAVEALHRDLYQADPEKKISYDTRLRELMLKPDQQAVDDLLGDRTRWRYLVKTARNALAHASGDVGVSSSLRIYLLTVTQAFVSLVIAQELGLEGQAQRQFVRRGSIGYCSDEFEELIAAVPLPESYQSGGALA